MDETDRNPDVVEELEAKFQEFHPEKPEPPEDKFEKRTTNPYKPRSADTDVGVIKPKKPAAVENSEHGSKLVIRDTFFSNILSEMMREGSIAFDPELLTGMNELILDLIKRQTSIQMAIADVGQSITELGIDIRFNHAELLADAENLHRMYALKEMIGLLGVGAYSDDIMLRVVENYYGSTRKIEREKKASDNKDEEHRRTMEALTHKITKLLDTQLKSASKVIKSESTTVFAQRRGHVAYRTSSKPSGDNTES